MAMGALIRLLLLVLRVPKFGNANLSSVDLSLATSRPLDSQQKPGLTIPLMHPHHINSPFVKPNLTLFERVQLSVETSEQRRKYFQIHGKEHTYGMEHAHVLPFYSIQMGYIMQLTIGTPAKKFHTIMDTGSHLTWVICTPCDEYYTERNLALDSGHSPSFEDTIHYEDPFCQSLPDIVRSRSSSNKCLYKYDYGDETSVEGTLAYERFAFSNDTATIFYRLAFGCGRKTNFDKGNVVGIAGMGRAKLSILSQMPISVFSYCLVDFHSANTVTSILLLGSPGNFRLKYTSLIKHNFFPFYYISVKGIDVNGKSVNIPGGTFKLDRATGEGGFVIDSAATFTHLDSAAYTPFLKEISTLMSRYPRITYTSELNEKLKLDICYNVEGITGDIFPKVVFRLDKLNIDLPSNNVFLKLNNEQVACLAFKEQPRGTISVFGNIQQQDFQIAYDPGNNKIGFAYRGHC